jgi:hypothetical protein
MPALPIPMFKITEGWTTELGPFTLKNGGVAYNLDGMTVTLMLRGKGGILLEVPTGQIRKAVQAGGTVGQVYYKPLATDLDAEHSLYTVRWQVVDGADDVVFFPNGDPDYIEVKPK